MDEERALFRPARGTKGHSDFSGFSLNLQITSMEYSSSSALIQLAYYLLKIMRGGGVLGSDLYDEPRYVDIGSRGEPELPSCWDSKPRCASWTRAVELGAELGNESAHTPRLPAGSPRSSSQ